MNQDDNVTMCLIGVDSMTILHLAQFNEKKLNEKLQKIDNYQKNIKNFCPQRKNYKLSTVKSLFLPAACSSSSTPLV
jgi:uncharacterized protein YqfB (UPF0267 family)